MPGPELTKDEEQQLQAEVDAALEMTREQKDKKCCKECDWMDEEHDA